MQCVVLAGGFATRMLPLTQDIPKSLIDIDGNPFIFHQLSWMVNHGVTNIVICIGHLGNMIKEYVGNSFNGVPIKYVDEGDNISGTAGALKQALKINILHNDFAIIYGDSFLPIDFSLVYKYFLQNKMRALMTIYKNDGKLDSSNVIVTDDFIIYDKKHITASIDKFSYIDYGLSVLSRDLIETDVPDCKYGLSDLFFKISTNNILRGYEVYERFFEIGSFSGLNDFKEWISEQKRINNS